MTMFSTTLETTPTDILLGVWRDPDTPPGVTPTWSVDNTRGELDALRVGQACIILHGGEFANGPTYWVTCAGSLGPILGTFVPHGPPEYHDTTAGATLAILAWVEEHTRENEGAA